MNRHIAGVARWMAGHKVGVAVMVATVAIAVGVHIAGLPTEYEGEVVDAEWTHTIIVERYQAREGTAFYDKIPPDAFAVVSAGEKVHHHDSVHDGEKTEYYTVSEACGSTCTSGRCRTRYCNRQRTRTVPKYKQVPQYAESFTYKVWDWGEHRKVHATGHGTTELRWPDAEAKVGAGLTNEREEERSRRESKYLITVSFDNRRVRFEVAADALSRYAIGSKHSVVVKDDWGDSFEVDQVPIVPR